MLDGCPLLEHGIVACSHAVLRQDLLHSARFGPCLPGDLLEASSGHGAKAAVLVCERLCHLHVDAADRIPVATTPHDDDVGGSEAERMTMHLLGSGDEQASLLDVALAHDELIPLASKNVSLHVDAKAG